MGMPIVSVAPFIPLKQFDQNLSVHPGLHRKLSLLQTLKLLILFVIVIERRLLKILHDEADDLLGPLLHALHVKVNFGADLVFGGAVLLRGVRIDVMNGTAMSTGDNDSLAGFFLDVVKKLYKNGIDVLLAAEDREAMATAPFTVRKRGWLLRIGGVDDGGVESAPLATEKIFGDPGELGLRFPRIGSARSVGRGVNRVTELTLAAVNPLPFAIEPPDLFRFRLFHPRTADEKKE